MHIHCICIVYSFRRKEELYHKIDNNLLEYNTSDKILQLIYDMVLSHTLSKFSNYLENVTNDEKNIILNNQDIICESLKDSKWNKGLKLFQIVIAKWKNIL